MDDLQKTRLFALLSEPSQTTLLTNEMDDAYRDFKKHLRTVCDSNDNAFTYRSLSTARVELIALETILRYGSGEKHV